MWNTLVVAHQGLLTQRSTLARDETQNPHMGVWIWLRLRLSVQLDGMTAGRTTQGEVFTTPQGLKGEEGWGGSIPESLLSQETQGQGSTEDTDVICVCVCVLTHTDTETRLCQQRHISPVFDEGVQRRFLFFFLSVRFPKFSES